MFGGRQYCWGEKNRSGSVSRLTGGLIMTREELMQDDTQYCCYCGGEKVRFSCCGEVHFQTFSDMTATEQDEFLQGEED